MDAQAASPKRRAPLAALDVNAAAPSPRPPGPKDAARRASPGPDASATGTKRPADDDADADPAPKRPCLARDEHERSSPSHSPDASSVFDASWATMTTTTTVAAPVEPDGVDGAASWAVTAAAAAAPAQRLTREQAREKVEILRLRLGLASYKLRTGQTAIPLADLQPRPLPPRRTVRLQSPRAPSPQSEPEPSSNPASSLQRHPRLGPDTLARGGAVSGLLSLARSCETR
ncbi:hypothetical protein G6O67_003242 [Ophiocordyceps sinensis]|uniref:Cyclin-dependent kinase n=1 Tax=Ophiocordyceps sinensis TaxID=72228 RepID=A0A8H4V832_9HYPO|nr:hypothetical protein G6O67_003242 [Ophiocordyceps sinensis]